MLIMTRRVVLADVPPPLLVWREQSEIERLQAKIDGLAARIAVLRPHSHYRLELEVRLKALRSRQLTLECAIGRRA